MPETAAENHKRGNPAFAGLPSFSFFPSPALPGSGSLGIFSDSEETPQKREYIINHKHYTLSSYLCIKRTYKKYRLIIIHSLNKQYTIPGGKTTCAGAGINKTFCLLGNKPANRSPLFTHMEIIFPPGEIPFSMPAWYAPVFFSAMQKGFYPHGLYKNSTWTWQTDRVCPFCVCCAWLNVLRTLQSFPGCARKILPSQYPARGCVR